MGNLKVKFKKLNENEINFLQERIAVNVCEICNKKANLEISENGVEVNNICCNKFAKLIGDSLTIRNINNTAIEFRGKFLNDFCILENFIDAIIEIHLFIFKLTPSSYFKKE